MADDPERASGAARLLAVDLGQRTGLAVFGADGTLLSYGSKRFGARQAHKRAASRVVAESGDVAAVIVEGERQLARWWTKAGQRRDAATRWVTPETWRRAILHPTERRDGRTAKRAADRLARRAVGVLGGPGVTSLRDDAAEAICIGLWGLLALGWVEALPEALDLDQRGG